MEFYALILLLFSLLPGAHEAIEYLDRPSVPVQVGAVYHEARGATWCERDGTYRVRIATRRDGWPQTLAHELVHAFDCADNGLVDGSPGHPRPAARPPGVTDIEWASGDDAHWYVGHVLATGDLGVPETPGSAAPPASRAREHAH